MCDAGFHGFGSPGCSTGCWVTSSSNCTQIQSQQVRSRLQGSNTCHLLRAEFIEFRLQVAGKAIVMVGGSIRARQLRELCPVTPNGLAGGSG